MFPEGGRYNLLPKFIAVAFIAIGLYVFFKPVPHHVTYLALGDSYTVGTHLGYSDNYPMQVVAYLREQHIDASEPVYIAHDGWTSGDLSKTIRIKDIRDTFTFVTLLIGANNQFRGLAPDVYRQQFSELLTKAISFAGGRTDRLFVLSVPDWSASPFAKNKDKQQIATEIAGYNTIIKEMTLGNKCRYIDIAGALRPYASDPDYFLSDYIHPSAKGYAVWVAQLAPAVAAALKQ